MGIEIYNKLVRDNIPDIIERQGKKAIISLLSDNDYKKMLKIKLLEETNEYLSSSNLEELVDILEVIYALLEIEGVSRKTFEKMRLKKKTENGAFNKKYYLEKVIS